MDTQTAIVSEAEIYRAVSSRFEKLNALLYTTPSIFSGVIGGLWFVASREISKEPLIALGAFAFAGVLAWSGGQVIERIGHFMGEYLNRIADFEGARRIPKPQNKGPSVIRIFGRLMRSACVISAFGAALAVYHAVT